MTLLVLALLAADPLTYTAHRLTGVVADGRLEEWAKVPWTPLFVDIEGAQKPLPRFQTRAKMAWDVAWFDRYVRGITVRPSRAR